MSTNSTSNGNPSLNAGRPATSGNGRGRSAWDILQTNLFELRAALAVSYSALDGHADLGYGGAVDEGDYFRTESGRSRLDRLDWLSIESIVGASVARAYSSIEAASEAYDQLDLSDVYALCEAISGWIRVTTFQHVEIGRGVKTEMRQMLGLMVHQVDRFLEIDPSPVPIAELAEGKVLN